MGRAYSMNGDMRNIYKITVSSRNYLQLLPLNAFIYVTTSRYFITVITQLNKPSLFIISAVVTKLQILIVVRHNLISFLDCHIWNGLYH